MTRRTPYVATFDEGQEDINVDAAAGDIAKGKISKKGFVKRILNKTLSKDNVNYMIYFSRLSCDPRQSFGTELTKRRTATAETIASIGSSAYVKCIQTNMGDLAGIVGNLPKKMVVQAVRKTLAAASVEVEGGEDSIISGEVVDDYKLDKKYTIANDVLSIHTTRSIDEKGGLLVIKLDNKNGKYNDVFVRGDSVDIRIGYGELGSLGTDYQMQNIWLGTISSVLVEIDESGETITIHGIDYFNVLKDKSVRNILIDKVSNLPHSRRTTHDVKSLISSLGRTMTDEFGHTKIPMYYKTIGSQVVGTPTTIGKFNVFENVDSAGTYYPDARYRSLITEQSATRLNLMTESPLLDDNVWDFFQGIFEEKGLYMRLKKSSIRGAGFKRGSPQLILAPKNMLTSEVRRVVDRWDDPHSFALHDVYSTIRGTDDVIDSIRVYEDGLNIKNRVLVTAQIPIVVQTTVREQDSERTRIRKIVKIKSIVIDSNHLLFPERYHDWARRTKDRNVSIRPSTTRAGIKSYRIKYHLEEGDPPIILNFTEYLYDKILGRQQRLSDIPIQVRPEKTITLKDMIEGSQRFHGERTKHIYFDGVALINKLYGSEVGQAASVADIPTREVGKTFSRTIEREAILNPDDPEVNYDVIKDAILREIIQTLVEHLYAVKGSITLAKGNPSIDLFDCCKITDRRELKIGDKEFIEDSQYTKTGNLMKKVKGTAHKLGLKLPPPRSIGALFKEFRVSNKDLGDDAATIGVRRPDGGIGQKSLKTIQELVYLGLQPRRRYIVHQISHNIDANGFSTSVFFTLLPQFSSSSAVQKEVMQALHSHRVDSVDLAEISLTKRNQLLMGEVTKLIKVGDRVKVINDYLKYTKGYFADGGEFDGSPRRTKKGRKNLHFDRVIVSVNMGDGGRANIPATVLRQKGIYASPKIGDRVIIAKFIRTNEPLVYADWIVLGVFESDAAIQTPSIIPLLFDGERGYTDKDIYLKKDYKTGFSNAVDLIDQQRQQALIISNNDFYTELEKPSQGAAYSTKIDKPEQGTKVAIESISKRTSKSGKTSRRQKASINLNTNQPIGSINDDNSGKSLIELATYEVDPSTGIAKLTQPFSYITMNRNINNQAEINMVTKDGGNIQSQLILNDDGVITATTKNLYLYGTDMTIIGNDSDSDTKIIALDGDDIDLGSYLNNMFTVIAAGFDGIGAYVNALGVPLSSVSAPMALAIRNAQTALQNINIIGTIVTPTTRKIKGKS